MATSGALSTSNQNVKYTISITQNSQSVANNTSNVTVAVRFYRTNTGYTTYGTGTVYCKINGTQYSAAVTPSQKITNSGIVLFTKTLNIAHSSDGSKTLTCSAWISHNAPLTSSEQSYSQKLSTIARASTITSAAALTLGNKCNIQWTPKSAGFRYKIVFAIDTTTLYTTGAIYPAQTAAYTYTGYTPSVAAVAPYVTKKTGTMKATLYTYSDSGCTKQVGSADSETFTVTVPENTATKPTVEMLLSPVHSLGSAFNGLYIQNISRVKAAFGSTMKYSATLSGYSVSVDGVSYGSPYQSGVFTSPGSKTVTGKVADSRGHTGTISQDITVLPYARPGLTKHSAEKAIVCERSDENGDYSDEGVYLHIKGKRYYSPVTSGGVQKNFCGVRYTFYKEETLKEKNVALVARDAAGDDFEFILPDVVSDIKSAYTVILEVYDDIGNAESYAYGIPTAECALHLGKYGKNVAVGKYCNVDKTELFECAWDAEFDGALQAKSLHSGENGEIVHDGIVAQGKLNEWTYVKYESGLAKCWRTYTLISYEAFSEWGSLYAKQVVWRLDYPFAFAKRPFEMATVRSDKIAVMVAAESWGDGINTTTQTAVYCAERGAQVPEDIVASGYDLILDLYVTGYWK